MGMTLVLDTTEYEQQIAVLARPQVPLMRALNRSIASGNTLAARLISQNMGLKVSTVKTFLKVSNASPANLEATLSASPKRVPLYEFGAKGPVPSAGKPGGVRAKLTGGAGRYPNAFIATMPSGHVGVFQRKAGVGRLPIVELRGPSIWKAYQSVEPEIIARTQEQLVKNVASEITYALSRGSGR